MKILKKYTARNYRIFTLLLTLMPYCACATGIDTQVENILAKEPFSAHATQISSGILDNRGVYLLALVENSQRSISIYLIKSDSVLDSVEVGSGLARPSWRVDIKKRSAFISVDSSGGCCSHSGMTYQLRLNNKGKLVLIGYEGMEQSTDFSKRFSEESLSLNLMTGNVVKSHAESGRSESVHTKPDWRIFNLLPPIKKTTRQYRVKVDKQWGLHNVSSYDDAFSGWVYSTIYDVK